MKHSFMLLSLALAALGANAQTAFTTSGDILKHQLRDAAASLPGKTAQKRDVLADNQKYVGNDMADQCSEGFGITGYDGPFKAAGFMAKSMFASLDGCKIVGMRFYLCQPIGATTAFVRPVADNGYISDPLFSVDLDSTAEGWNYVKFGYSYTISAGMTLRGLMAGYDFTQTGGSPLGVSGTGTDSGLMVYGNLDKGEGWYNLGTDKGNLMVQLIVERDGGFLAYDLAMDKLIPVKFARSGEERTVGFYCHNDGTADSGAATFGIAVDGNEVADFEYTDGIGKRQTYIEKTFDMSDCLEPGEHRLSVYVKSAGGDAPQGNTSNDLLEAPFKVYTESFPRQKQLVEHFTSQYCTYCPRGYDVLNALAAKRDDVAWVSVHNDMGASQKDEFTLPDNYYFSVFSCGANLPAASFNRYYLDNSSLNLYGTVGLTIAYPSSQTDAAADMFSEIADLSASDYPSFTTVDIATTYDEATRQLDVTVSGKTAGDLAGTLGDDAVLTVYLTEDGLWGRQKNEGVMMNKYPHDHVLRQRLTSPYGDDLDAAGGIYEHHFSTTVDNEWDAGRMHVVAVVSRPMKTVQKNGVTSLVSAGDDLWVDNTEMVKLGENSATGIHGIADNAAAPRDGRIYTIDGRYAGCSDGTLPKGVYIRNGRKFVVK